MARIYALHDNKVHCAMYPASWVGKTFSFHKRSFFFFLFHCDLPQPGLWIRKSLPSFFSLVFFFFSFQICMFSLYTRPISVYISNPVPVARQSARIQHPAGLREKRLDRRLVSKTVLLGIICLESNAPKDCESSPQARIRPRILVAWLHYIWVISISFRKSTPRQGSTTVPVPQKCPGTDELGI